MKKYIVFLLMYLWNKYVKFFLLFQGKTKEKFKINKLKILIIKPYNYLDIYSVSFKKSIPTIMSSIFRFGPVGLLLDHNTDFCIVDTYNGRKINFLKFKKNNSRLKYLKLQKKNAIDIKRINFDNYDLVISFEHTVEDQIIKKFKRVLWAIIYEDHKNPQYIKNLFIKSVNFDLVLNQTLGFTPYSFFRKIHWIDFSYTFGNSSFLKKIGREKKKQIDIVVEVNQKEYVKNNTKNLKNFKFYCLDEQLSQKKYFDILSESKFFLAIDCKSPRWGNSLIEAALSKNLIIGNKNHFWNSHLILNDLHCDNFDKALKLIKFLKNNKKIYRRLLAKQNSLLDYLNYKRPLIQIVYYAKKCNRDLNILKKI